MLTNSNFYIGDSSISRLYKGDNIVWDASHPDILLEYISNDSSTAGRPDVYFDSGVYPDISTNVEISYQLSQWPVSGVGDSAILFGCTHTTGGGYTFSGDFYLASPYYRNSTFYAYRTAAFGSHDPQGTVDTNKHMLKVVTGNSVGISYYDDSSVSYATATPRTMEISAYIMARHYNDTYNLTSLRGTRLYYMKVWKSNNLVRFYIPVLHWNNGQYVPCFYDKVNDTYIYNLGTDTPTYKIQGDYLLDFLGAQPETAIPNNVHQSTRYETGLIANNQMAVDTRFRIVYGRENFIYGSATSRDTTPAWQSYSLGAAGNLTRIDSNHGGTTTNSITIALTSDTSTISNVHTFSTYFDDQGKAMAYLDSSLFAKTVQSVNFSSEAIQLLTRRGYDTTPDAGSGSRIYYINFTNSNIPAKTYIPVLHNNQAAFLDLNSGTYIYNLGTAAPYYQFKN